MIESPIAVIVDADLAELRRTEHVLRGTCSVVKGVGSFPLAKALLGSISPDIVIADVRLEAYNGLHLAAICAIRRPGTPFIVTHSVHDVGLAAEARRLGAAFVVKTSGRDELMRTVFTLLDSSSIRSEGIRRSHRKRVPVPTAAKVASSEAEIVDVSYGGLRLRVPSPARLAEGQPPVAFDITLPQLELSLRASRVWAAEDAHTGGWSCGADVSQSGSTELHRWRDFVDSMN
jgi:FixJ family two-component response regulator